jgi:hypothetical protein
MKKTPQTTIDEIRNHVEKNPSSTYRQVAALYGVSEITVKRACADLGRGKNWRRGRQQQSDHDKFWSAVDRSTNGCWEWRGSLNNSGYGSVYFDGGNQATHRVAYTLTNGPIADGLELDHTCRNRACCNPEHLEPVTHAVNMERVRSAGALSGELGQPNSVDPPLVYFFENIPAVAHQYRPALWSGAAHDALEFGHREQMKLVDQDRRWGLEFDHLGRRETWPRKFLIFTITSVSPSDGIRVRLAARSADFAREMFESAWVYEDGCAYPYDIDVKQTGYFITADSTALAVSGWQRRLKEEYMAWESTSEGTRCLARLAAESRERREAEELEREIRCILEEQSELEQKELKQKAAAKRSQSLCPSCGRPRCPTCGQPRRENSRPRREYDELEIRDAYPDEAHLEE